MSPEERARLKLANQLREMAKNMKEHLKELEHIPYDHKKQTAMVNATRAIMGKMLEVPLYALNSADVVVSLKSDVAQMLIEIGEERKPIFTICEGENPLSFGLKIHQDVNTIRFNFEFPS